MIEGIQEVGAVKRMRQRSRGLRVWLSMAVMHIAVLGALNAQARSVDFTPAERAQFTDEVGKWPRIELPLIAHNAGAAGWLDERRVVYSTREIVGIWKAGETEMARLVVFDVQAKTVTETPYRGNLVCFTPERMLVSLPKMGYGYGVNLAMGDQLVGGKFGEPLMLVDTTQGTNISSVNCDLHRFAIGPQLTDPAVVPLRSGDGHLQIPRGGKPLIAEGKPLPFPGYARFDASGRLIESFEGGGYPSLRSVYFLPWLGDYFSDGGSWSISHLFWQKGGRTVVRVPALLAAFDASHEIGSAIAIQTRIGTLWNLVTWNSLWRMQGLYLSDEAGKLRRIDHGSVPADPRPVVSEDGCSIFYLRREGEPFNARHPFVPTIINLCDGVQK